jgi:hypothetical protein
VRRWTELGLRRRRQAAVVLGALLALLAAVAAPAAAVSSVSLDGDITDRAAVLDGRADEVQAALDRLKSGGKLQLFVVFVESFDGTPAQEWTDATATRNGLGLNDALLAVAVRDRQYAYSVDVDVPLTDAQLREVAATRIEPALQQQDWAGAAIGAADGYAAALSGGSGGSGGLTWLVATGLVVVLAVGGMVAVVLLVRSRRRRTAGAAAPDPVPLEELDGRASRLLVQVDDAVKTSEQELGFAIAQFGDAAAEPFALALDSAKAELTAAFRIRQALDDAVPEDDATRRTMITEILTRCQGADDRLDAQAEAFDRLRSLEARAPQVLVAARAAADEAEAGLPAARGTVERLAQVYADSAWAAVADNPDQAEDRLQFARDNLAAAEGALAGGRGGEAAVALRAAEEAIGQAGQLVQAVASLASGLEETAARLQAALDETDRDLGEARALIGAATASGPAAEADLAAYVARAEAAAAAGRREMAAERFDPMAALRRIEEADAVLDQALAGVRDRQERDRRARASLDQAIVAARSEIAAASDFITTRRGAVGSTARTRLAAAERHLDQAVRAGPTDAATALAEAQRADAMAEEAARLARGDVEAGGGGFAPGFPAPGGYRPGGGVNGAVLGGILIDSILRGGLGGLGGGGFGGGGARGSGRAPRSFGGSRTRGRRGGGGRF